MKLWPFNRNNNNNHNHNHHICLTVEDQQEILEHIHFSIDPYCRNYVDLAPYVLAHLDFYSENTWKYKLSINCRFEKEK
jgi:hypothetical protein